MSEETIAIWLSRPVLELMKAPPRSKPAMISGIRMVVSRNPRVRMRSMYSRRAMSQTLCIDGTYFYFFEQGRGNSVAVA